MNTLAIIIGLAFGVLSAVLFYGVSMVTSGLFARPFYRLYARVLIGICCAMLAAPLLRYLADGSPVAGLVGLSIAQYSAFAVLGYGVYRFNRGFLKRVYLRRKTTTYFVFGTLAYATIVTLVFLHFAVSGTPSWAGHGHGFLTVGHYGPLLVLLAVMVFDTDTHLKASTKDPRRFSRFTFVGYAISFLGLAVSTVPFAADALHRLNGVAVDTAWLTSLSSAEALLIAIILYAWLVWRYETIPPLFLLLASIVAEYHVLVTQWALRVFGPESWGLVSIPLFALVMWLEHYFSRWNERKDRARDRMEISTEAHGESLRFAMPFSIVQWGLAAALLVVTFWTRFYGSVDSPAWLGVTLSIYSGYFLLLSFLRKQPGLVYFGGSLVVLAACFGLEPAGGPLSALLMAAIAVIAGLLSCMGRRVGLKESWQTPLTDLSLVIAGTVVALAFSRHLLGPTPYQFDAVGLFDGIALLGTMVAFVACAFQYRSQVPVFGVLLAAVTMIPMWSAGLGLLATFVATWIDRQFASGGPRLHQDRVSLLGRYPLPLSAPLPELLSWPLSLGGIPLALLGLAISVGKVAQGDLSWTAIGGSVIAAIALLMLTRTHRNPWLYVTGLLATYFSVHALVHRQWLVGLNDEWAVTVHLAVCALVSLSGWLIATAYAAGCTSLLRRCAESREAAIRMSRSFYCGWLYQVTAVAGLLTLGGVWATWATSDMPLWTMISGLLLAVLFALATPVYRSGIGAYVSLAALTVAVLGGFDWLELELAPRSTVIAGLSLVTAFASCWLYRPTSADAEKEPPDAWFPGLPILSATGTQLWCGPLAVYALACSPISVASVFHWEQSWSLANIARHPAPLTYLFAGTTLLLSTRTFRITAIYAGGVAFLIASWHAAAQLLVNRGWFDTDLLGVHLIVGTMLSLAGCLFATWLTWQFNRRAEISDGEEQAALKRKRVFYAGTLHHFALMGSSLWLAATLGLYLIDPARFASIAGLCTIASLLLAVTFYISGLAYRSQLQTYGSLTAALLAVMAMVSMQTDLADPLAMQLVAAAMVAWVYGIIAWWLMRRDEIESIGGDRAQEQTMRRGLNACWEKAPLPLVSWDRTLWSIPLANGSTIMAMLVLVPLGLLWHRFPAWMVVTPIFLASLTWLTASLTHGIGFLSWMDSVFSASSSDKPIAGGTAERGLTYLASLIAFGVAVHVTLQLTYLTTISNDAAIAWHLVIAAGLSLIGWLIATILSTRLAVDVEKEPESRTTSSSISIYSVWLHHVVFTVGISVLTVAITLGLSTTSAVPVALACAIVMVLFAGCGSTYRSQLGSYLSLGSLGVLIWQILGPSDSAWATPIATVAWSYAVLGAALTVVAGMIWWRSKGFERQYDSESGHDSTHPKRNWLPPTAWSRPPLPMSASSWPSLWYDALCHWGLIFAFSGVAIILAQVGRQGSWGQWGTSAVLSLVSATIACFVATALYRTTALAYVATVLLSLVVFPASSMWDLDESAMGTFWSLLAVILWLGMYVAERLFPVESTSDLEGDAGLPTVDLYRRPMIRASAILAIIAIGQNLFYWTTSGESEPIGPLLTTSVAGTVALLLNARLLSKIRRFLVGQMLVYVACLAITSVCVTVTWTRFGLESIAPSAAVTALVLSVIGLSLLEWVRVQGESQMHSAVSKLTFAEPMSHYASWLALVASVMALGVAVQNTPPWIAGTSTTLAGWLDALPRREIAWTFSIASIVSLLTVRAFRRVIWLDAAVVLGSSGLLLLVIEMFNGSTATLTVAMLASANVMIFIARALKRSPQRLESLLGLHDSRLDRSFFRWPLFVTTGCLAIQAAYLVWLQFGIGSIDPTWPWLINGLFAGLLFFHVLYLQPHPGLLHLLVSSTVVSFFGASLSRGWDMTFDVALAVMGLGWGIIAMGAEGATRNRVLAWLRPSLNEEEKSLLERALVQWAIGMSGFATVITLPIYWFDRPQFPNLTVSLLCASTTFLLVGIRWRRVSAINAAAVLFPISLACTGLLYLEHDLLRDNAGLALSLLAFSYVVIEYGVRRSELSTESSDTFSRDIRRSMIGLAHCVAAGAVVATVVSMVMLSASPVFVVTLLIIAAGWLWLAWESGRELLVYTSAASLFGALLYAFTVILGLTFSRSPAAAFSVIGYSFALYGVNVLASRSTHSRATVLVNPTYYLALWAPVALALVTPLDQKGVAAFTFLAAGAFYLTVSQRTQQRLTMYVAAGLFNVAIYLWVPEAREFTGLAQLYVIPAAITVLIFAQLHRHDLKPQALNGIRTAASGAILAVSTFEVFFANDTGLLQFIAVLGLSLLGIAVGISLRIRPFISIGIAFLVLNVLGQLGLQFQREGGIIRAVILIGIGVLILGLMIFFNIHRERILRQYRGYIADENWE